MMRQFKMLALTGFALAAPLVLSAQSPDQAPSAAVMRAVEAAFPKEIRSAGEPPLGDNSLANPNTCAAVFSWKADGTPDLVVASYHGKGVKIAMLAYGQGTAQIIRAVTDREFFFGGDYCGISIINLDDPAHHSPLLAKTVAISFGGRTEQNWYFVWNGKKLVNITALDHDPGLDAPNSAMPDPFAVDVDHSGAMQIVGNNEDGDKFPQEKDGISATPTLTLFRYNGSNYVPAKTLLDFEEYKPNLPKSADDEAEYKGGAPPWTAHIYMHQTPAPTYQLKIVNGDRDGSNRVTSAKVEINGGTIVSPTEVDQRIETLTRTIQLQKENTIKVTVDGPAKSHIYVTVE